MVRDDNSRVAVTLVHGTWGRGFIPFLCRSSEHRWFEKDSSFAIKLAHRLAACGFSNVVFRKIEWSGANSFASRDKAARALAAAIDTARTERPDEHQLVIGHSHGGNIALHAVEYLKHRDLLAITSLATPFVELFPQIPPRRVMPEAAFAGVLFLMSAEIFVRNLFGDARPPLGFNSKDLFFVFLVGVPLYLSVTRLRERLARRLSSCSRQEAYRQTEIPTLVLRGIDDEAALALAMGSIATRLGRLFSAIGEQLHVALLILIALFLAAFFSTYHLSGFASADEFTVASLPYMSYFNLTWPVLAIIIGGSAYLAGAMPAVFGRELFLTYVDVRINSNSSPDSSAVTTVTLTSMDGSDAGLIHSIYSHPECVGEIADWYSKVMRRSY